MLSVMGEKLEKKVGRKDLHFNFSSGSCNVGVFEMLWWWWWWCWFDVSWVKWFKLLLPDDIRPVIADDTLTADATESCKLWWLCKWSLDVPLFWPVDTKSCRHNPCVSDIFCIPRSISVYIWVSFFLYLVRFLSVRNLKLTKKEIKLYWSQSNFVDELI